MRDCLLQISCKGLINESERFPKLNINKSKREILHTFYSGMKMACKWKCSVLFVQVPRVLRLFGQRLVARRDSGVLEFYYRRISAVKQWEPLRSLYRAANEKKFSFFEFSRVSPGTHPLTKKKTCQKCQWQFSVLLSL